MSCEKESTKEINISSEAFSENRSELGINYEWLEEFRLNLLSTEGQFYYTISEVEYGIETIYNIIGSVGPMKYTNPKIYKDSILIPLTDGVINGSNVKNLSSKIFSLVEGYVFKSNRGFLFVDLNIEQSGSDAMARISVTAGDISEPDLSSPFAPFCEHSYFTDPECFRSAEGNPRVFPFEIYYGGQCGDPNNETSAQFEVEKAIIQNIPRFIYKFNPFVNIIEGIYKYTNPITSFKNLGIIFENFTSPYSNCSQLNLSFIDNLDDIQDINHQWYRLNCKLCTIYDYIESIRPSGKVLCDIIVHGDGVYNINSSTIWWHADIVFCDVEIIPPNVTWNEPQQPILDLPTEDDFLMVLSFLEF